MNRKHIQLGIRWIRKHFPDITPRTYSTELRHYGVKGMKWGVRRTPEQLGHKKKSAASKRKNVLKKSAANVIIEEAVKAGKILKNINKEKQKRHTKTDHIPGRSYLDGDIEYAQKLVDKLSGTGDLIMDRKGNWTHHERVTNPHIVGTHVDKITGLETRTNKAVITYSKTGTHIYPTIGKEK